MKKILIIIDPQKAFINEHTKGLPERIKNYLNKNKSEFDFVLFTKFINKPNSPFTKKLGYKQCSSDSDSEIVDELKKFITNDNLFIKETYSVFKSKKILNFIKKNKIKKISLCGLTSDGCVLASAFEGFDLGFDVGVIKELTGTCWGDEKFNKNMIELMGYKIDPKLLKKE